MAAFWNIVFPYNITFEDTPENLLYFQNKFGGDFVYKRTYQYHTQRRQPVNGNGLSFTHTAREFAIEAKTINLEFKALYKEIVASYIKTYSDRIDDEFYSNIFDEEAHNEFINELNATEINTFDDSTKDYLRNLKSNKFIFFDKLFSMIVYEGFSFPNDFTISCVSVLSSYKPMNFIPNETLIFHEFIKHVNKELGQKYKLAKYAFLAGY